jgi:hypothetical protein
MKNADLRARLVHAATEYDMKREAKGDVNPARLSLIFARLDLVEQEIAAGTSVARALYDNFNDRLLTVLEKAAGVPVTYGGGKRSTGRPD